MHSTPIDPSYYDNPAETDAFIKSLSPLEAKLYTQGYIQACNHFLESLIETKNHFLNAALGSNDDTKTRLLAHVKLLDMLDTVVNERVQMLQQTDYGSDFSVDS